LRVYLQNNYLLQSMLLRQQTIINIMNNFDHNFDSIISPFDLILLLLLLIFPQNKDPFCYTDCTMESKLWYWSNDIFYIRFEGFEEWNKPIELAYIFYTLKVKKKRHHDSIPDFKNSYIESWCRFFSTSNFKNISSSIGLFHSSKSSNLI
jgi:hypothetical protein